MVSEGAEALSLQVVVVCFSTTPGRGSVTEFLSTTVPLSQVVVVLWLVTGAGGIAGAGTLFSRTVVVVVCVAGAGATTGGVTWTTGAGAGTFSTVLEKHPAIVNATDAAITRNKIR